jgi:hypothetical protein
MDFKSLSEVRDFLGYKTVEKMCKSLGEKYVATVRIWLKTHPRRLYLMMLGLKYEQMQEGKQGDLLKEIESGEKLVVKRSSVDEVLTELEKGRQTIDNLNTKILEYKTFSDSMALLKQKNESMMSCTNCGRQDSQKREDYLKCNKCKRLYNDNSNGDVDNWILGQRESN